VDTVALTGLRGLAALHVALGHYSSFSVLGLDLIGGASMSFFYLLSGFVMTLGYASAPPSAATWEGRATADAAPGAVILDQRRFWKNRFARLFPMYLLTNAAGLALQVFWYWQSSAWPGIGPLLANFALVVLGLNMWLYPLNAWIGLPEHQVMLPFNLVSWTVQTMSFFYLVFPALLPWLHGVRRRQAAIRLLFCLQSFTFMSVLLMGSLWVENDGWAYWTARAWPFGRLPVFVMGCLAALERAHGDEAAQGTCCCPRRRRAAGGEQPDAAAWSRRATLLGTTYLCVLAAGAASMRAVVACMDSSPTGIMSGTKAFVLIRGACEAFVPLLFVDLITALTRCGSEGAAARLCRWAPVQKFGDLSMTVYLVHLLVLTGLMSVCLKGMASAPLWLCGVSLLLSVLLGWLLANYFEAPCRRRLRG